MQKHFLFFAISFAFLISCQKESNNNVDNYIESGSALIVNEGGFTKNNGSLSYISRDNQVVNNIFEKSIKQRDEHQSYVFYDGPPFATGLPHYGHLVASITKDVVPRYWTMKGYYIERKWGWDCHGLPIENLVEQELKIKSKKDIEVLGVKEFNNQCRSKVLFYGEEWKKVFKELVAG